MKILYKITKYILFLVVGFLGCGCSSEPEESSFDPANENSQPWDDNNTSFENKESISDIKRLIEECVSVSAKYEEYMWYFTIESTLHHKLPNRKIEFGIGHGDINDNEDVSIENNAYVYSCQNDGRKKNMSFINPFWFYYIFGVNPCDKENWTFSEMYYASYKFLKEKGYVNLNQEEKESYNKLEKLLTELERPASLNYQPAIEVLIDSKFYLVKRYKLK